MGRQTKKDLREANLVIDARILGALASLLLYCPSHSFRASFQRLISPFND